ncbi:hypothetical protein OC861_001987 [Tilletia horrida]|nr:hypothetical protein OC861_001987 [Tilletia horrida]
MSRYNTDMWMSRYGALAATNPSSGKRQEQDRPQRIETDAGSETSYSLSIPPHQKKPRRLTSFEQSIRSERESAIPPAKEAAVSDNMLPPSTDSVDVQTGRATRMNSYRSDSSTGSVLKARAQVSPPAETLAQTKRPENDSEPAPLLRPLSVCEQIDYLADGGREGIDSATLNSLMPEDGSSKRQRGLSGSAATGITQMAAGLKAKLRTGKAGDRLSPAASQGMLPPMPLKSPNRPTVKLFGRRSSALPSSNVSLKEDSASLLVSSPMPMKGSEVSSVHGFLLHPPGESKGPSGSPTPAQALAADYGRNRSASVVSRLSINTLQSATRRVSTTLGPTMKGKGNALRLSGMGNSAATPKAPTRTITTGMIGSPVLVASTDQRTDTVEETPDPYAHRRSIATSRSIAPEWLESIAMDTSSSDENEDSQEPVQDPEQSAGLSSAMASSTVLSQYAENSLPRSLSKTIISKPLPESSIEHRLDDKPLPEVQDCEAGVQSPAELEEEQREELRHQEDERLLADKPHGVSPSHTPAYTPSVSTLSSLKTHNHEPRPLLNASEDVGRPSEELGLEQFSFLVAEAPDEGMTTGKQKSGRMEKSNSKSTTLGQLGQISPPASSPEVGSSGPQSCAETPAGDESNSLRLPDTTGQRGLVSTRTSNRSSTSLRNRLGRASSFLPNSPSPVSQSSRNMGSHDVHTSVPQSPGPPSPALTPSPKEKELPEPVPARTETEQSGKSPSKSPIPKRRAEPALASTDQDLKPNATPASSRSSLLKKLRPSLIPRKSASTMKSSSSDMGSQSESDQKNGDRSVLTRPTVPKSTSFSSQRKLLDRGLAEPGDSSLPIVTIGKKEAAPPAAPVERPVSKDGVQALALDWLHAHTLVEQGFEAADVDVDDQVQAADESRSSSKIPVRSQTIGSGLGLHVARPKDAAPAVPAKNPTPLYAHITPPGSDGGQ